MADKRVAIEQCLSAAKSLRSSVSQVFEDFVSNPVGKVDTESSDLAKSSEFVNNLKKDFVQVQKSVSNLEKTAAQVSQFKTDSSSAALGNSGLLSLDPCDDKTPLYRQLIGTYNWHEKLIGQSLQAFSSLKRNHPCSAKRNEDGASKRTRFAGSSAKSDMERLDKLLQFLRQKYTNLRFCVFKACGALLLEITIPRTLKAMVALKGFGIEQVMIRGIDETTLNDQKEDIYSPSRHKVFNKLTAYATSAMLHYYTTSDNILQVINFVKWLDSFQGIFSKKCTNCGFHLKEEEDGCPIPPCWRAYDTLQPYHYSCYTKLLN
ncbi:mediator of RNA polymerase II transcription subunit 27-like [Actinia tenebrosa]|uniref:Mediator of RNA polymerase II transcription subunit 27-like n=1 Tax=Actinia tenebrosa TaxID=6105 RepID=A0A6P8J439_ACTTE|nr:mediator of RNA polymerase II transcription subunit 27-like [Actinia tenebrosa]